MRLWPNDASGQTRSTAKSVMLIRRSTKRCMQQVPLAPAHTSRLHDHDVVKLAEQALYPR